MNKRFDSAQVSKVIDQALIYQCACPAQVCRAIYDLRELHEYQMNCANSTENDRRVHSAIALAAEKAHEIMEACLDSVLEIEGWDRSTLAMPDALKKKTLKSI